MAERAPGKVSVHRVAVASYDGKTVHEHFGRARQYLVFDVDVIVAADGSTTGDTARLVECRPNQPACRGGDYDEGPHADDAMARTVALLEDCEAVLVRRIGPGALVRLTEAGVRAYVTPDFIPSALAAFARGVLVPADRVTSKTG